MNKNEINIEKEWLEKVLKEIQKQLDEKTNEKDNYKKDAIQTQREMWNDLGPISIENGIEQLSEFMSYMDIMKMKQRTYEFAKKLKAKYENMIKSPYFGRIDFKEDNDSYSEKCYIGLSNLVDENCEFLIYDWRAPISSMFYDYEIGKASYECLDGIISGEIITKRQYKIKNSKIEYMFDSNINIDDEMLQELLSNSSDDKMKGIVTTIQKEQNKVIRNEDYKNIIVQGAAGSGKTSVALHRIAYLLYKHKDKITSENIMIFSPNNIFNDYISNVLPQLGEENMLQTTFKDYTHNSLPNELKKESPYEMMEYILDCKDKITYPDRIKNINFKTSNEFINILKNYVKHLESVNTNFKDIQVNGNVIVSSKDIQDLFFKDYSNLSVKKRLEKIKSRIEFLIEPHKEEMIEKMYQEMKDSGDYVEYIEKDEIMEKSINKVHEILKTEYDKITKMTNFNLLDIYKNLFKDLYNFIDKDNTKLSKKEIEEIKNYTLDNISAKVIYYEDQIALLYLKVALGDIPNTSMIKYVIIDEAQDYTPLQYEIFHKLFKNASMTILGDINQSINPFMNVGSYDNIYSISNENTCVINLSKTYRSTMEITRFARKLLNQEIKDGYVERHGDEPKVINFKDENSINKRILDDIKEYKAKGYKSIGIITRTEKEARKVYENLKLVNDSIKIVTKDDEEYINGVLVIPSYMAKGLEFDVVIIYNAGDDNYNTENERLLLYTSCTRALHVLNVYYTGKLNFLLDSVNLQ